MFLLKEEKMMMTRNRFDCTKSSLFKNLALINSPYRCQPYKIPRLGYFLFVKQDLN